MYKPFKSLSDSIQTISKQHKTLQVFPILRYPHREAYILSIYDKNTTNMKTNGVILHFYKGALRKTEKIVFSFAFAFIFIKINSRHGILSMKQQNYCAVRGIVLSPPGRQMCIHCWRNSLLQKRCTVPVLYVGKIYFT